MTLSDQERKILIQYRLEQAEETREDVRILLEHERFRAAVNRIYYGMFYGLTALALKYGFESSKHTQLIGWFNKNFVSKGLVDESYGKMLNRTFNRRLKGDYDTQIQFERETVERMYQDLQLFIEQMKALTSFET